MALPATIAAGLVWSNHKNARHGVFESGSALYCVLQDSAASTVEVWKSTDSGDTWAEQDAANHKTTSSDLSVDVIQDGTSLWIVLFTAGGNMQTCEFAMATDAWGTPSSLGVTGAVSVTGVRCPMVARRSDGDQLVLSNSATENVMGTAYRRVSYSRLEVGVWTTIVTVSGTGVQAHYDARAAILGSSDRVHFFWTDTTNSDLKHRSLSSANVLGTIQDIDTSANVGNYSAGLPVLNSSEVVLPYVDSTGDLNVARATSADNPTWSITQVVTTTNDPEVANANPGAAAVDGSTVHVFWPNDADQDIYRDSDGGSGTWGTDVEWKDAVTCAGINITKITNAIGVLYNDGGTVKYDVYTLVVTKAPPPFQRRWRYLNRKRVA